MKGVCAKAYVCDIYAQKHTHAINIKLERTLEHASQTTANQAKPSQTKQAQTKPAAWTPHSSSWEGSAKHRP